MKISYSLAILFTLFMGLVSPKNVYSQGQWEICDDGSTVANCRTYNCPKGDTNKDGRCNLMDQDAVITDFRADAFCANPVSGCGEVHYFSSNSSQMCSVRVKESRENCSLYSVSNPTFTPIPTPIPTLKPIPSASLTPQPVLKSEAAAPVCVSIVSTPAIGNPPFDVKLTVTAKGDPQEYEFDFGDGKRHVQSGGVIIHRYENTGEYIARARVTQTPGKYIGNATCFVQVSVIGPAEFTKGGQRVQSLPETGSELYGILGLIAMGFGGIYLYERFRVS